MSSIPDAKSFPARLEKILCAGKPSHSVREQRLWALAASLLLPSSTSERIAQRACRLCALKFRLPNPAVSPAGDLEEHRFGSFSSDLLNWGLWEWSPETSIFQKHPEHCKSEWESWVPWWDLLRCQGRSSPLGALGTARWIQMQMGVHMAHFPITSRLTRGAAFYPSSSPGKEVPDFSVSYLSSQHLSACSLLLPPPSHTATPGLGHCHVWWLKRIISQNYMSALG